MAGEWKRTTIGETCEVFDGPHPTPRKTDSGPTFHGISSLQRGRINLSEKEHLSEEDFMKWTRRVTPRSGDVVFSYETRVGEAALIPQGLRCCLGRRMGLLRPKGVSLDPRFLLCYYLGPEFQEVVRQRTIHGSTVERLALIEFPDFPIRMPPLAEQKAIAAVLGTLDDKIELNRRMNATLEGMARALFQSWFVDFDPVRAKLDGRQPPGLDEPTAALFPAAFQESPIGHIPKGWDAVPLYDTANFVNGAAFRSEDFCANGEGLPVIKIAELKDGIGAQTRWSRREAALEQVIDTGDLLYSWSGSPDTSLDAFLWSNGRGLLNQHIFKVIPPTAAQKRLVYYLLKYFGLSSSRLPVINKLLGLIMSRLPT